jgi:hypothetical protein
MWGVLAGAFGASEYRPEASPLAAEAVRTTEDLETDTSLSVFRFALGGAEKL